MFTSSTTLLVLVVSIKIETLDEGTLCPEPEKYPPIKKHIEKRITIKVILYLEKSFLLILISVIIAKNSDKVNKAHAL
jgi:hypothetical protein